MSRLLDLLRLIPGAGKVISMGIILIGAIAFIYIKWGLVPALVVGIGILLIMGLIFGYNAMIKASERQSGKAFGKAIRNAQVGASRGEIRQAVDELGDKWQEAISNFKNHELSLYELPWYMLVGEPQSGKSTTLKFSGLKFPIGTESISGGGGTRNCDWWFTEEGIILDTAGRFTFQETTATDAAEWGHFLSLLGKYRPYCPINGIILVIPVTSLLGDNYEVREQKARNISDKLRHIQRVLAIQFPVFVLLTKADTIFGFTEFFNKLSPDQQREMMGWSNPVLESGFNLEAFDNSFEAIKKRVHQIRVRNLSRPQYSYDSNKTFIFPEEFNTIHDPLRHYLSVIFESSVYKTNLFFRGYYVTSGMQEGLPIIRACRNIVKEGALSDNLEKVFTKSRAFFIRDFYTQKVFPEQGLVQRGFQFVKKDRLKKRIIYSLNTLLLIIGLLFVFFMHRSLTHRLDRPKTAITQTLQTLEQVQGDFFSSPESRETIYKTLQSLQSSLSEASEASYLLFLKGKQNTLTESLQDAFGYLFLDRVLTGLFDSTVQQLSQFSLVSPGIRSEEDLNHLLNALGEENKWRYQVALGDEDGFEPSIDSFLPLVINPQWDKDLAAFRHDLTISQEMSQWFQNVYTRSSEKVQIALIRDLVRRSDHLFDNLHLRVVDFYNQQPEMIRYVRKAKLIDDMQAQYSALKQPHLSVEDYNEKLGDFAESFSDTNLALFQLDDDIYLPFSQIRERTINALGPQFPSLMTPETPIPSSARERQRLQVDAVKFVNQLMAVDIATLKDPAKGRETKLEIPPGPKSYWDEMGQPYYKDFLSLPEFNTLPNENENTDQSLMTLFDLANKRMGTLQRVFVTGAFNAANALSEPDDKARFEKVHNDLYQMIHKSEMDSFYRALVRVSRIEPIRAPAPSSSAWNSLSIEFERLTDSGMDFSAFFKSLDQFSDRLEKAGEGKFRVIFGSSETPLDQIKDYKREVTGNLKSFGQAIQSMSMISNEEIASNRRKYQGNFREKTTLLQLAKLDGEEFPLTESHLRSLNTWSTRFYDAWQAKVGRAEVCPACPGIMSEIKAALKPLQDKFPITYSQTSHQQTTDPGETVVNISKASQAELDTLFEAIGKFKNPDQQQKQFIRQKGLGDFFDQAFLWMDYIDKLQKGSVQLSYKLTATDSPESIARTFSFADLDGAYKAKTLNLNSPSFRQIEPNSNNEYENTSALFTLFNDTEGNMARSVLKVSGSELDFIAFILDSTPVGQNGDTFDKEVPFLVNINQRQSTGTFRFKLSEPTVLPPHWETLGP